MLIKRISFFIIFLQLFVSPLQAQNHLMPLMQNPLLGNTFADFKLPASFRNSQLMEEYYERLISWNPDNIPENKEDVLKKLRKKLQISFERALKAVNSDQELFSAYLILVNKVYDDVYRAGYFHGIDSLETMELLIALMEIVRKDVLSEKRLKKSRKIDKELFLKEWFFIFQKIKPYLDPVEHSLRLEVGFQLISRYFVVIRKSHDEEVFENTPYDFIFYQQNEINKDLVMPVFKRYQKYFHKIESFRLLISEGIFSRKAFVGNSNRDLVFDLFFFYSLLRQAYFKKALFGKFTKEESSIVQFLGSPYFTAQEKMTVLFYFITKQHFVSIQKADLNMFSSYLIRFQTEESQKILSFDLPSSEQDSSFHPIYQSA